MTVVDADALREKYRAERTKRRRPEGVDEYTLSDGELARFDDDPHAGPPLPRQPLTDEIDVLVIGAGFGGICVGARLRKLGLNDFRIIEKGAGFGGVWYWNRYPGLRCDIESYIYLPLLEESGYMPTERYVSGTEIREYAERLAAQHRLGELAVFQTEVTGMRWDVDAGRWLVETSRSDRFRARMVVTQSGLFLRPKLPGVAGIERFQGCSFHTARWDFEYTGGEADGKLDRLDDKRIAFIGTGTTALQAVPKLAEAAQEVTVFQRTPTAVAARNNGPTDPGWFRTLPRGWQRKRTRDFSRLSEFEDVGSEIEDGWVEFFRSQIAAMRSVPLEARTPEAVAVAMEVADYEWNERVRARVDSQVADPEKRQALKAYYRTLCKRPGFSDDYLPALDRAHVRLVDTTTTPIEEIIESGIRVGGTALEFDCIVFGTGFEVGTAWAHQAGYDVECGGDRASVAWADGVKLFQGLFSHEFPNAFFMGFDQSGPVFNAPELLGEQAEHVAYVIRHCLEADVTEFRATAEAQVRWGQVIAEKSAERRPFLESCTPGWVNAEGKPDDPRATIANNVYTPANELWRIMEQWRRAGDFEGIRFRTQATQPG